MDVCAKNKTIFDYPKVEFLLNVWGNPPSKKQTATKRANNTNQTNKKKQGTLLDTYCAFGPMLAAM